MIMYSDTSKLIFSNSNNNSVMNLKSNNINTKANSGDFKSFLESASCNSNKRTNQDNISKNESKYPSRIPESGMKNKSFKDLNVNETAGSVSSKGSLDRKTDSMGNIDSKTEETKSGSKDYDETINILAQMLGIQPGELVKLIQDMNLSPDEIKDTNALGILADKLSNVLGLDEAGAKMLKSLMQELSQQTGTNNGKSFVSAVGEASEMNNIADTAGKYDSSGTPDISGMAGKIKARLEELMQITKGDPGSVKAEILKAIAVMRSQVPANVAVSAQAAEEQIITGEEDNLKLSEPAAAKESPKAEKDDNTAKSESVQKTAETTVSGVNASQNSNMTGDQDFDPNSQGINPAVENKVNAVNTPINTDKAVFSMKQTAAGSNVINQVVENAKVIVGQDKSEMVIQLKPDHLGKLELKVVTEQGIVAAKFVAESQQVKEILESNMQLLKDSLQKQGISVNAVSVQVGQDNRREYQRQNTGSNKNGSSSSAAKYGSDNAGTVSAVNLSDNLPERLAPYLYEPNTINLTA